MRRFNVAVSALAIALLSACATGSTGVLTDKQPLDLFKQAEQSNALSAEAAPHCLSTPWATTGKIRVLAAARSTAGQTRDEMTRRIAESHNSLIPIVASVIAIPSDTPVSLCIVDTFAYSTWLIKTGHKPPSGVKLPKPNVLVAVIAVVDDGSYFVAGGDDR